MSNISTYSTTAASNNSASPNGFPEGMAPSGLNDSAREVMAALAKWYAALKGGLVTTGTSTAYVLTTGSSHATLAAIGLVVFRVHTASGAAPTLAVDGLAAKEIRWNGVALTATALTQDEIHCAVYNATGDVYDLISTPHNLPALKALGLTYPTSDGTSGQYLTTNGSGTLSFANAAQNITRTARTSNTILAAGDKATLIDVTSGTFSQTFTAAATLGAGWFVYIRNSGSGVVTLDPDGSETIDGSTTKTLMSGQQLLIMCDGSNFFTVIRAQPGLVLLASTTASASATVDFTGIDASYDEYELHILNAIPATDATAAYLRTSTDGGSTFDSGASDYYVNADGSSPTSSGAAQIELTNGVGTDTNEAGVSAIVKIIRPADATFCGLIYTGMKIDTNGSLAEFRGVAQRRAAANVDAIRFLYSSGNVESGEFKLYGVRKA